MKVPTLLRTPWTQLANFLASVGIPLTLVLLSFLALFFWQSRYDNEPEGQLQLRVLGVASGPELRPVDAAAMLMRDGRLVKVFDQPIWVSDLWFTATVPAGTNSTVLELPSRHVRGLQCWVGTTYESVPRESSVPSSYGLPALLRVKSGYAIAHLSANQPVLCHAETSGPAKLTALLWQQSQFNRSVEYYERRGGISDAGLLVLSVFLLISALFNRSMLYFEISVWLFLTARLNGSAIGWDSQWLGAVVPDDLITPLRLATRGFWVFLLIRIYRKLFDNELRAHKFGWIFSVGEFLGALAFFVAILAPMVYAYWYNWVVGSIAIPVLATLMVHLAWSNRSPANFAYAGAFVITAMTVVGEIFYAALAKYGFVNPLDTMTTSLAAGFLASVAVAEQQRAEHALRVAEKHSFQQTYDLAPECLFSLDSEGRFIHANQAFLALLGTDERGLMGMTWGDYFPTDVWGDILRGNVSAGFHDIELLQHRVRPGRAPESFLIRVAHRDGGVIECSLQSISELTALRKEVEKLKHIDRDSGALSLDGLLSAFDRATQPHGLRPPAALAYCTLEAPGGADSAVSVESLVRAWYKQLERYLPISALVARVAALDFAVVLVDSSEEGAGALLGAVRNSMPANVNAQIVVTSMIPGQSFQEQLGVARSMCLAQRQKK